MEWRQVLTLFIVFILVFSPVGLAQEADSGDSGSSDSSDSSTDSGSSDSSGDSGSSDPGSDGSGDSGSQEPPTDSGDADRPPEDFDKPPEDFDNQQDGSQDDFDHPDDFQDRPPEDFRPPEGGENFDPARRCGEEGGKWDGNNCIFDGDRPPGDFDRRPDDRPPEHRPPQPPPGCHIEEDQNGFDNVVCEEMQCPKEQEAEKQRCTADGGKVNDHRGCAWTCDFGGHDNRGSGFFGEGPTCQPPEELERSKVKCKENGGNPFEVVGRGCQSIQCDFGGHGREGGDIYASCRGEVKFVDGEEICVERGSSQRRYHEVERVPDVTELLEIAFKLEDLKIVLEGLVKKSDSLADYYSGRPQEEKFRRIAAMFDDAKFEVDDIKKDLRDRLNNLEKDDISQIIDSIRYIKEVVIKDIVYVMLSDDEEIPERRERDRDFDDEGPEFSEEDELNMRTCKSGFEFNPEGSRGPTVRLDGVDDQGRCVLEATEGDRSMTCKFDDWQKVMRRGPTPADIDKSCEGELKDMMKDHGGPGGSFDEKAVEDCIRDGGSFAECSGQQGRPSEDFRDRPPQDFRDDFDRRDPDNFRDRPPEDFNRPPEDFRDRPPEDFNRPPEDFNNVNDRPVDEGSSGSSETEPSSGSEGGNA